MRRVILGAALLVALLVLGIFVAWTMNRMQLPLAQTLENAADAALYGEFSQAVALGNQAKKAWKDRWGVTASLADHVPMDEIDGLFAQLEAYAQEEEKTHYAACCWELASLIQAVAEAHSASWWNLL